MASRDGLPDALAEAPTVLVVAEPGSDDERRLRDGLLERTAGRILFVTYDPPDDRLGRLPASPDGVDLLAMGEEERSVAVTRDGDGIRTVETLEEPGDLTGLGMRLTDFLSRPDGSAVCIESLSAALEHVDLERLFRFVNDATRRLRTSGARGHFHMAPDHDAGTVNAVAGLVDATVRVENGSAVVRRRERPA